jgi:hypothetical protein
MPGADDDRTGARSTILQLGFTIHVSILLFCMNCEFRSVVRLLIEEASFSVHGDYDIKIYAGWTQFRVKIYSRHCQSVSHLFGDACFVFCSTSHTHGTY